MTAYLNRYLAKILRVDGFSSLFTFYVWNHNAADYIELGPTGMPASLRSREGKKFPVANWDRVNRILDRGLACVPLAATRATAVRLGALGFRTNDALHIAAAYTGGADYAVSCDRQHWIRRAARVATVLGRRPAIVTPEECLRWEGLL